MKTNRPAWLSGSAANDFEEDFVLENGNYYCICLSCGVDFIGYKRRKSCKVCEEKAKEEYNSLTFEEKASRLLRIKEWMDKHFK